MGTETEKKETKPGAVDDDARGRSRRAREAQKRMIEEAGDTDSAPKEDPNSAAWNRGRNAADPSRTKTTKSIKTT
jgi:hypothetical protein